MTWFIKIANNILYNAKCKISRIYKLYYFKNSKNTKSEQDACVCTCIFVLEFFSKQAKFRPHKACFLKLNNSLTRIVKKSFKKYNYKALQSLYKAPQFAQIGGAFWFIFRQNIDFKNPRIFFHNFENLSTRLNIITISIWFTVFYRL